MLLYIKDLQETVYKVFKTSNIFLSPHRGIPQRVYNRSKENLDFENIIYKYIELGKPSEDFVNEWMKKFEIGNSIVLDQKTGFSTIKIKKNNKDYDLTDLGYGVTQLLPIILCSALSASQRIFIEEPESHLHPKLQSILADFIINAKNKFYHQYIIETHSEYLIHKFQYLVAMKQNKFNKDDIVIYYIDNDDKKINKTINIKENGELEGNFGEGFIEESANIIYDLWQLRGLN